MAAWLSGRITERVVLVNYPSSSDSADLRGEADGLAPGPGMAVRTLSVDPHRSMKAATAELETALLQLGADMSDSSRRRTALLASELIAQVAGRDLDHNGSAVGLTLKFRSNRVRLETRGPSMLSGTNHAGPGPVDRLAEWGPFVLNRVADSWGVDSGDPALLWAEVRL